ncbi:MULTISPECIES: NADH-quinone oxidoreductase subunit NuoG [Sphingomonas]|uniref:NADH-quinone oxidoreductase n=1 Tax=Sphingomonas leidyi TaxID=68569 RepID=A0A7X5UYE7_9SPHN|nr:MULTISPECIES: NADH-quinone oxidoreductase subunit NuoG [Sphingomonas]MBN8810723.1 NADH-quinone oxidoreductase subunit G [Sphingomonas sp.]NIJ64537.1 NADH-quinone oxidoreductase subunit G [Sphingomonas leidyi]OJY49369.1 MAG: NADH-quinone oxidoreductase subunit G [Sphingomonas sp. 67-41]
MPKLTVDGIEVEVPAGATVLQACEAAGKEIPRFCYHERLSIAGNCRMCLVEVKPGPPKPQASCALPAADNQEIRTDSPMVKAAREGVMEFLLINHPLDCPICDQGGECDLQDQSVAYGRGHSRYTENKRAVTEKYMGPIIKTIMTRCIQCTRCVRFGEEVAGVEDIGAIYRGENMQITTYLEKAFKSELSGNAVDLCPVGALTHKPVAFEYRSWELKKNLSIDVMDAVGTNIRLDSRGRQVMRVLPRINEDVNEEWAHDKTRYHVDALVRRRLDKPYVRKDGKLVEASWDEAFDAIAAAASKAGASVAAIAGDLVDCETMYAAKALVKALGSDLLEGRQTGLAYDVSNLGSVAFNTTIAGVEDADAILLVGSNLRFEAPLINTRVRKAIKRGAKVFAIGPETDLTYKVEWLGNDLSILGKLPDRAAEAIDAAKKPVLIVGPGALKEGQGATLAMAQAFQRPATETEGAWNGFNVVHTAAARMGGLMLGYAQRGGIADIVAAAPKLTFFLGADEVDFDAFKDSFKVYIGHHGDNGAHHADVILPGATYAEKPGTYVNLEGRVQRADRAVFAPGDAREDWTILRALSDRLGHTLPFDNFEQLRAEMAGDVPALGREGLAGYDFAPPKLAAKAKGELGYPIADFYLTNAICRASPTMQRCSAELIHGEDFAEAAE